MLEMLDLPLVLHYTIAGGIIFQETRFLKRQLIAGELSSVFQFGVRWVYNSHPVLGIMKNRRYNYRIQSFGHRFAQSFQVIFAVLTTIIFDSTPKSANGLVWLWEGIQRKKGEIPLD